ncbi:MAG TPA: amino acid permease [Bacteroidia bacterium]|nr:amino acid permease [Bacteroidia bacterium]
MSIRKISFYTAVSVVIANMIGTGVFTSLGFQLKDIQSVFAITMLWVVGGIIALCGALSYGELASAMPRSGGEYQYLSKILHPFVGFLSGWVSVTVGFSAPVALSAMALGKYVHEVYPLLNEKILGCSVVILITLVHSFNLKNSAKFQNIFTVLKVVLIVVFITAGFFAGNTLHISVLPINSLIPSESWKSIFSPAFAVSLIYVSYAYSGWNASAYMSNDIENPRINVPKSLFWGTAVVMILYVLLNYIFLYTAPIKELQGQVEVGYISAIHIFGTQIGNLVDMLIALLLVSSVSSMVFAGPRVSQVMGEDLPQLSFLSKKNKNGIPVIATLLQSAITILLILTSTFGTVLLYLGFTLSLFTFLTVFSLFVMRIKKREISGIYKTFAYPITPIIFLLLTAWTLFFTMKNNFEESILGLLTVVVGGVVYFIKTKDKLKKV